MYKLLTNTYLNNTMQIANPIYDTIFKYLMDNVDIAKDILSVIVNKNIVSIVSKPEEVTSITKTGLKIFRLDFKAIIETKDGTQELILIEIQKSNKGFEIKRFRSYLGLNYIGEEEQDSQKSSLPITSIYFLGFRLKNIKIPVLKVARSYTNAVTQKKLKKPISENFVEQLSHDMYVIQIPRLRKMVAETPLEKILDVFSQTKYKTSDTHVLDYTGDMSDPRVERIVKYLNRAMSAYEIRRAMDAEDEVERALSRIQDEAQRKLDAERAEKEAALQAKEEALTAKEEALKAKEKAEIELEILKRQLEALLNKPDNENN
ncbi:MAG: hypothetical protein JNL70_12620 [Saprospiraceae bacterium]|nr:hypothetical protein [Saprospiraceae bacterium]